MANTSILLTRIWSGGIYIPLADEAPILIQPAYSYSFYN